MKSTIIRTASIAAVLVATRSHAAPPSATGAQPPAAGISATPVVDGWLAATRGWTNFVAELSTRNGGRWHVQATRFGQARIDNFGSASQSAFVDGNRMSFMGRSTPVEYIPAALAVQALVPSRVFLDQYTISVRERLHDATVLQLRLTTTQGRYRGFDVTIEDGSHTPRAIEVVYRDVAPVALEVVSVQPVATLPPGTFVR